MNYTTVRELCQLEELFQLREGETTLILRAPNSVVFFDKASMEHISTVEIPIDNHFGPSNLEVVGDICFTSVFPKEDPFDPPYGESDYAELHAYSKSGMLWSRELVGWMKWRKSSRQCHLEH